MWGGGGVTVRCRGGGGGLPRVFWPPTGGLAHGQHPRFVVAEIWADWDIGLWHNAKDDKTIGTICTYTFCHQMMVLPTMVPIGLNKHHKEGLIAATGLPRVYTYSYCHRIITQAWPKGPQGLSEVTQKSPFFNQPMPA